MSKNPHPDAGMPNKTLDVGCVYVCIPCTIRSRHEWCQRAYAAERELAALRAERDALLKDKARLDSGLMVYSSTDSFGDPIEVESRGNNLRAMIDKGIALYERDAALDRIDKLGEQDA